MRSEWKWRAHTIVDVVVIVEIWRIVLSCDNNREYNEKKEHDHLNGVQIYSYHIFKNNNKNIKLKQN